MVRTAWFSVSLCVLAFTCSAFAAESPTPTPAPTPGPPAQTVRKPGEQIRFVLTGGREAAVSIIQRPGTQVIVPFAFSETSCELPKSTSAKCAFLVPIKLQDYSIKWTKHPDASKIGQVVKLNGSSPLTGNLASSQKQQLDRLPEAADLTPLIIRCDDFTWMTGTALAPDHFSMEAWSGERMANNPETGAPENETYMGFYSPEFARISDHELAMTKTGDWFGALSGDGRFWFLGANIIQMISVPAAGRAACQTAVKPDFSTTQKQGQDYLKKYTNETPLIDGPDHFWDEAVGMPFSLLSNLYKFSDSDWQ